MLFSAICKNYLKIAIKDPALRKKLTPDYKVGCKRIVISNKVIPALQKENVALVTDGIKEINETGVITQSGEHHELDVLILSTGFNPVAYMRPMELIGKDGLHINEAWQQKIQTYRSVCMPGFPNNFLMLGPNSPIGNYSVIEMSEVQTDYIIQLIERWMNNEYDTVEVKPSAVKQFADYIRAGMNKTVWVGGCQSWYLDKDGDPILWPYTFERWRQEMATPDMTHFDTSTISTSSRSSQ